MKKIVLDFLRGHEKTGLFVVITGLLLVGFLFDLSTFLPTKQPLQPVFETIAKFIVQFNRTPESLREIEMFADKEKLSIGRTNGLTQTLKYQRLNHKFFIVQEYIDNQFALSQTRLAASNAAIASQEFDLPFNASIHFYPFEMLEGIKIGDLNIGLTNDYERSEKHLLASIKNASDGTTDILVAAHDFVDEFLVLPGNRQVLFSASAKKHFGGGLYFWDLISNQMRQVTGLNGHDVLKQTDDLQTTLVGMTADVIYFFMKKNTDSIFSCNNLFGFNIHSQLIFSSTHQCQLPQFFSSVPFFSHSEVAKLLLTQNLEKTIEWWQETLSHADHDLASTPHALWILANLYMQLSEGKRTLPEQKKILQVYAKEILAQLSQLTLTPRYLREAAKVALSAPDLASALRFRFTTPQALAE